MKKQKRIFEPFLFGMVLGALGVSNGNWLLTMVVGVLLSILAKYLDDRITLRRGLG